MSTHQARKFLRAQTTFSDETFYDVQDFEAQSPASQTELQVKEGELPQDVQEGKRKSSVSFSNDINDIPEEQSLIPKQQNKSLQARVLSNKGSTTNKKLTKLKTVVNGAGIILKRPASSISKAGSTKKKHTSWFSLETWFHYHTDVASIKELFLSSYLNIFLILIPLGFVSKFCGFPPAATFAITFGAIIPLALILGDITEDLALRFGEVIGGLINATFGNVVELMISIISLSKGMYTVIQLSLLGSILSNLLLVLGFCFLFGGIYFPEQRYSQPVNKVQTSLLFLSCIALIIPDTLESLQHEGGHSHENLLLMSRIIAAVLLVLYICFLVFQLKTHNFLFQAVGNESQEEEAEEPALSVGAALLLLTIISTLVAFMSEYLVSALEELAQQGSVSETFLSIIVLPIAGNACEHLTAVIVAMKDKMDLSVGIAIGSSIQIAMFVLPVSVIIGWMWGKELNLEFDGFGVIALTFSVIHTSIVAGDGVSNWLMGLELIATFSIVAVAFWFRQD